MASLVSRLVACLVAVVAVLQLVHLVLLNQLESRRLGELHHLQNHHGGVASSSGIGNGAGSSSSSSGGGGGGSIGLSQPVGQDHPRRASIINGPQRLSQLPPNDNDIPENEEMAARLARQDEGTIVDSTGEFRIVFDLAGPRIGFPGGGDAGPLLLVPPPRKVMEQENDDFSIDDEIDDRTDVTLVTQSDLTTAKIYLLNLVERWQGPIALTMFARNASEVEGTLRFIAQTRRCHEWTRQYVSFHLVFPLVESPNQMRTKTKTKTKARQNNGKFSSYLNPSSSSSSSSSSLLRRRLEETEQCQKLRQELDESRKQLEMSLRSSSSSPPMEDDVGVYPINLLRNVARKRVMSEFSFVTDIDMLPSIGLRSKFQKFAKDKLDLDKEGSIGGDEKKSVFVVAAFESKNGEAPGTKSELLQLIEKYQVRPFYFDLCWKCQVHTDYETWQRERESKRGDLSVLFEVLWKDPWEPFFISHNSVPLLDERFRQHGFNRISQLCELHVAGFKFSVLNDAFLIHQGYKTVQSFQPSRNRQVELNRINFRQFKIELKDKYPHSTRRCY